MERVLNAGANCAGQRPLEGRAVQGKTPLSRARATKPLTLEAMPLWPQFCDECCCCTVLLCWEDYDEWARM